MHKVYQCWVGLRDMPTNEKTWTAGIARAAREAEYEYKLFSNDDWVKEVDNDEVYAAFFNCYRIFPCSRLTGALTDYLRVCIMKDGRDDAVWWFDTDVSANFGMPPIELMNAIGDTVMFRQGCLFNACWGCIYKANNTNALPFWTRVYNRLRCYYLKLYANCITEADVKCAMYSNITFRQVCDEAIKTKDCIISELPSSICNYRGWSFKLPSYFVHHDRRQWLK